MYEKIKKVIKVPTPRTKTKSRGLPDGPNDVPWQEFDEISYVDKSRCSVGQDCYAKNKYNQLASDNLKSNRGVPDTRNMK